MLQIGLVTVIASSDAVTTQVYCVWVPSRSAMIVGSAVETMVALTIATNSADIRPTRTSTISLWLISSGVGSGRVVSPRAVMVAGIQILGLDLGDLEHTAISCLQQLLWE